MHRRGRAALEVVAVGAGDGGVLKNIALTGIQAMRNRLAQMSVAVGGLATAGVLVISSGLFFVARGSTVFPLGWMLWVGLLSGFALLFGAGTAIYAMSGASRRLAVVGLVLSLLPAPVSFVLLWLASAICGFSLGG